jgi:N-acetylmuramic acid 6-phosphate etherase
MTKKQKLRDVPQIWFSAKCPNETKALRDDVLLHRNICCADGYQYKKRGRRLGKLQRLVVYSMTMEKLPETPVDLTGLQTEGRNPQSVNLDGLSTLEIVNLMNSEDLGVISAVKSCVESIAAAVDDVFPRIAQGGRLFYVGSGTSGRLGLLDAAEIPPTFSAPVSQFVGIISGGDEAIRVAQEGAEDSKEGAILDLQSRNLTSIDTVIGIASSGRTPYVISALKYARSLGCLTVGICCVSPSEMQASGFLDHLIAPVTGSEIVTGSTRLKAGTATKMALNILSTTIMVRLGKTYGNLVCI